MTDDVEGSSPPADNSEVSAPLEETQAIETQETKEPEGSELFQKRIDTVVGQRNETQRENEELKRQIEAQGKVQVPVSDINEPTLEQFDFDDNKFQIALIDYRVSKGVTDGLTAFQAAQTQATQEAQAVSRDNTYNQRVDEFAATVSDWNEVIGGLQLTAQAEQAIKASDVGPQIAYTIAKDPVLRAELNRLDPISAAMKVGEISQTVRTTGVTNKISMAPDPIVPPGGQGGALKESDLNKMGMDDFMSSQGVVKTSY